METLVDLILILNVGVGTAPAVEAASYAGKIGENVSKAIMAKTRGVEIVTIFCPGMVGCRVEIIPLKALLENKYVLKEEINLPEMEEVLAILKKFEAPADSSTIMDSATAATPIGE